MLLIPKLKITSGKDIILSTDHFTVKSGDSVYLKCQVPAGKTLLLQAVYFFLGWKESRRYKFIEKGEVFTWDVRQKRKLYRKRKKDVILIEDPPALIPDKTVNKNIHLPLRRINPRMKHKIIDYLQLFNLGDKQFRPAGSLSLSEKKTVELIRSLIILPEVLLIDDFDLRFPQNLQDKIFDVLKLMLNNGTVIIAAGKASNSFFPHCCTIEDKQVIEI